MKILIISIIYLEPEWQQTKQCIEAAKAICQHECDIYYVDRKGVNSLSEAINRGFKKGNGIAYDYVWVVTNPTFEPGIINELINAMDGFAAVHPAFDSDHAHIQPDGSGLVKEVPYIEFTAPMASSIVFSQFLLDEHFPFWAQDLDWSYRVQQAGHKVGVHHGALLNHTYIRNARKNNSLHPVTRRRLMNRRRTDNSTKEQLIKKYGLDWKNVLQYV